MSGPGLAGLPDAVVAMLAEALAAAQRRDHFAATSLAKRALRFAPDHPEILRLIGYSAREQRDWATAAAYLGRAAKAMPEDLDLALAYADALMRRPDLAAAIAAYRESLSALAGRAEIWINFSGMLLDHGRPSEAEAVCRDGLRLHAGSAPLWANLGKSLMEQYRAEEALAAMRRGLAIDPRLAWLHSNILFCLNYCTGFEAEEIMAEYAAWDAAFGHPALPQPCAHANSPDPQRRLRIGYVSPDFRRHAVAMFFEPILEHHDRWQFETFLYAASDQTDQVSERLRQMADHWRDITQLDDAAAADLIRTDRIDILVDLAGHTAGNRLPVFARRPAPVQFAYLIGQGTTTGLSAIDGFFADGDMAPVGSEHLFSEKLVRLGRTPLAYRPPDGMPDAGPLPALRNGYVTFGSLTRFLRVNDRVIAAWAAILQAVPGARLLLNNRPLHDPIAADALAQRFAAHGISRERLRLMCTTTPQSTWATYNEIDIALDPFPHNAGTTTIEALWMGVPVISKLDRPPIGRFGASILGAVGLADWVTADDDAYVTVARERAGRLDVLADLRQGLRGRVAASPLMDATGLTREMEAGYRRLWQDWCLRQAGR